MAGTLNRLRFYAWSETISLIVDYAPPLQDYPEYPRHEALNTYRDVYKSALGSNFWVYYRGTSEYRTYNWVEVSDDCAGTFGMICGSITPSIGHIAIYDAPGISGITFGSLITINGACKGTFFFDEDEWAPEEINYGLWNFKTTFRREA